MNRLVFVVFVSLLLSTPAVSAADSGFDVTTVASGFDNPSDMALVSGAGFVVSEHCGAIQYISAAGQRTEVANIKKSVSSNCKNNLWSGLLGIATNPAATNDDWLYVLYTKKNQNQIWVERLPYTRSDSGIEVDVAKSKVLIDDIPFWSKNQPENARGIEVGPNNTLFIGVGDDFNSSNPNAINRPQQLKELHGKLLRIGLDGSIPNDNPKFDKSPSGARKEIFAIGLNQPDSLGIDSETGAVWIGEVALALTSQSSPLLEVNVSNGGENFGWPKFSGETVANESAELSPPEPKAPIYHYEKGRVVVGPAYRVKGEGLPQPAWFQGAVPVTDFWQSWFKLLIPDGDGAYKAKSFEVGVSQVISIDVGDDGSFYVLSHGNKSISRLWWNDTAPTVSIVTPKESDRYVAGKPLSLEGKATDNEEGELSSGFAWEVELLDRDEKIVDSFQTTGKTAQYPVPSTVDIQGRMDVTLTVTDAAGSESSAKVALIPDSTKVTYSTDPENIEMVVAGETFEKSTSKTYVEGSEVIVSCPLEVHIPDSEESEETTLYVFYKWSDGEDCAQMSCSKGACCQRTYIVPSSDAELTCRYLEHGAPIPADDVPTNIGEYTPPTEDKQDSATDDPEAGCSVSRHKPVGIWPLVLCMLMFCYAIRRKTPRREI